MKIIVLTMLGALAMATGILAILLLKKEQWRSQWNRIADANTPDVYLSHASVVIDRSFSSVLFDGFLVAIVMLVLVGIVASFCSYQMTRPIKDMADQLLEIDYGNGDLSKRIDVKWKHDVGILAAHFNRILGELQQMMQRIAAKSHRVSVSSEALVAAASDLAEVTYSINSQHSQVAKSVQSITEKMGIIVAVSKKVSCDSESVAVSIEELTTTVRQLQATARKASSISTQAEKLVGKNQLAHQRLGVTANEIGLVTDVLENLRERIHVLALNSALEAARTGDAGNGFSVIATEVKQLEKQTVDATESILERMRGIHEFSLAARQSMTELCDVAQCIGLVSTAVASVVEEQWIVTESISQSLRETATNANSVASITAITAVRTEEISLQIEGLNEPTLHASQSIVRTRDFGEDLLKLTDSLQSLLEQPQVD